MEKEALRSVTGVVFNIQHLCIHDGDGIRTNVFVKGCPLHCLWCANPESQRAQSQLMYHADTCTGCVKCLQVCPQQAVSRKGALVATDRARCTACGACVSACPTQSRDISGKCITAGEAFDEVAADQLFYGETGGVTVTGGEALAHPAFTLALLKLCRGAGINTAMETCGGVPWEVMSPIMDYVDTVLYDIKVMDSRKHQAYTGVPNEMILQNLAQINRCKSTKIIARTPIIPGYNDGEANIAAMGQFLRQSVDRCQEANLLPFHELGEGKREQLEAGERDFHSHVPSEEEMARLRALLGQYVKTVK